MPLQHYDTHHMTIENDTSSREEESKLEIMRVLKDDVEDGSGGSGEGREVKLVGGDKDTKPPTSTNTTPHIRHEPNLETHNPQRGTLAFRPATKATARAFTAHLTTRTPLAALCGNMQKVKLARRYGVPEDYENVEYRPDEEFEYIYRDTRLGKRSRGEDEEVEQSQPSAKKNTVSHVAPERGNFKAEGRVKGKAALFTEEDERESWW